MMSSLDVLLTWASIFERLTERFESKSYEKYNFLSRSDALSGSMCAILGMTANQYSANTYQAQSIISMTNLAKLDQAINSIKTKILTSYDLILSYCFDQQESVQSNLPFIFKSIGFMPHLLSSLGLFATDA